MCTIHSNIYLYIYIYINTYISEFMDSKILYQSLFMENTSRAKGLLVTSVAGYCETSRPSSC